jgi:Ca-activated chloride channel family protein
MRSLWCRVAVILAAVVGLLAQQPDVNLTPRVRPTKEPAPETATDKRAQIRVDTTLVLIPTTVTTMLGTFVTSLDKENFKLYEDKVQQEISTFSTQDAAMSIGIVFDTSGSMGEKLKKSREAVAQFLKIANPEDEFFLVTFSERPDLLVPLTHSTEEISNKLMFVKSHGSTALLDGLYLAMNQIRKGRNPRKAILIISDGGDNSSRYTQTEVKNAVLEADAQIYGIGIFEEGPARGRTLEEFAGPELLHRLANLTGGRSFNVGNLAELPDVAEKIAIELRNEYVLGYSPMNAARDGKWRRVEVKLANLKGLPPLKAVFRTGYFAPVQ